MTTMLDEETQLRLENLYLNWSQHSYGYVDELSESVNWLLARYHLAGATLHELTQQIKQELT